MTASISLGVMELFRFLSYPDLTLVPCICLENCPFQLDFPFLLSIGICSRIWRGYAFTSYLPFSSRQQEDPWLILFLSFFISIFFEILQYKKFYCTEEPIGNSSFGILRVFVLFFCFCHCLCCC